jgi:hypothetical protein
MKTQKIKKQMALPEYELKSFIPSHNWWAVYLSESGLLWLQPVVGFGTYEVTNHILGWKRTEVYPMVDAGENAETASLERACDASNYCNLQFGHPLDSGFIEPRHTSGWFVGKVHHAAGEFWIKEKRPGLEEIKKKVQHWVHSMQCSSLENALHNSKFIHTSSSPIHPLILLHHLQQWFEESGDPDEYLKAKASKAPNKKLGGGEAGGVA